MKKVCIRFLFCTSTFLSPLPLQAAGSLTVALDVGGPTTEGILSSISANILANGGSVPDVTVVIQAPLGNTFQSLAVDGVARAFENPFRLGNMSAGESHVVTWEVQTDFWGVSTFSLEVVASDPEVPKATATAKKAVHRSGTLGRGAAVVSLGDAEGSAMISELGIFGWQATAFSPDQVMEGQVNVESYPLMLAYSSTSALPPSLASQGFTDAFQAYVEAGGSAVLLGTAAEILEAAEITSNLFSSNRGESITIENSQHPICDRLRRLVPSIQGSGSTSSGKEGRSARFPGAVEPRSSCPGSSESAGVRRTL
jgi:hypothetical protein